MTVFLVGAGPGDPGLLTRRAESLLAIADVVVHDRLVAPEILSLVRDGAECVDVGKRAGEDSAAQQAAINRLLIELARDGRVVVRLKGGDPFLFGRGAEEVAALAAAGIRTEVVPGVSAAFGVPAAAGISLTHRGVASSVLVVTGHEIDAPTADWSAAAHPSTTIVVLMGMARREALSDLLVRAGRRVDTPVAVIQWGTTTREEVAITTLGELVTVELGPPAVIVIGDVVARRQRAVHPDVPEHLELVHK
jgi:uroporphyrin-III C-methyltransferase